jgi:hypothetical protein
MKWNAPPARFIGFPVAIAAVAVVVAVTSGEGGGDGWESNAPRTPQQRPLVQEGLVAAWVVVLIFSQTVLKTAGLASITVHKGPH